MSDPLQSLLKVKEAFYPPKDLLDQANVKDYKKIYKKSVENPESFWAEAASELEWFRKWDKVLDWKYPWAKWFVGGKCNIVHNALDRHVASHRRNKVAISWEDENGDSRKITYWELSQLVNRFGNALKKLGIGKGDRVTIYMPRIPEQIVAMLACAKIGAAHVVVYSGFSAGALKERIEASESKAVVTADGSHYRGRVLELKKIVDDARAGLAHVKHVIVVRHARNPVATLPGDISYEELMEKSSPKLESEVMDAGDMLYMLYTSGTTGKPKGVVHVHGGYMVGTYLTTKWIFDVKDSDLYWCTADPGWVTGHSYIVYGPLLAGASVMFYEGAPDVPDAGRWWSIAEKYGVSILYSTPTAVRSLMRFGEEWPGKYDLSSLRLLGSVGEPINPEAWLWFRKVTGDRLPIMDTWWQTETGMVLITPLPCLPVKPGSAAKPFPGVVAAVVDKAGKPVGPNIGGNLVIKTPWPAMMNTIYKDPARYETYWNTIPGWYAAGDTARVDEDGYFWIMGRADDVLKVSGYRIGPAEVESALVSHHAIAEAAVIGKPDPIKGEAIKAFVILRQGFSKTDDLTEQLKKHVREELGPIAIPNEIDFVTSLPKTRSGKIMRRLLRAKELGLSLGDTSTLEE